MLNGDNYRDIHVQYMYIRVLFVPLKAVKEVFTASSSSHLFSQGIQRTIFYSRPRDEVLGRVEMPRGQSRFQGCLAKDGGTCTHVHVCTHAHVAV